MALVTEHDVPSQASAFCSAFGDTCVQYHSTLWPLLTSFLIQSVLYDAVIRPTMPVSNPNRFDPPGATATQTQTAPPTPPPMTSTLPPPPPLPSLSHISTPQASEETNPPVFTSTSFTAPSETSSFVVHSKNVTTDAWSSSTGTAPTSSPSETARSSDGEGHSSCVSTGGSSIFLAYCLSQFP